MKITKRSTIESQLRTKGSARIEVGSGVKPATPARVKYARERITRAGREIGKKVTTTVDRQGSKAIVKGRVSGNRSK